MMHTMQIPRIQPVQSCPAVQQRNSIPVCRRRTALRCRATATETSTQSSWGYKSRQPHWNDMWSYMTRQGLESVPPAAAKDMLDSGNWVLVDIRPENKFQSAHPAGAKNVQLYRKTELSKSGPMGLLKALLLASQGVEPVEANADFVAEVDAVAEGRGVIIACEIGGTLIPSENFPTGKLSRSLKAVHQLMTEGSRTTANVILVAHLKRGVYGWNMEGLPFEGEYDPAGAGRTPSVVEEEIFAYGRKTHIIEPTDMDPVPAASAEN